MNSEAFSYDEASQDLQLTLTPSQNELSSTYTPFVETERVKVIWGTTINVNESAESFKEFIRSNPTFLRKIEEMNLTKEFIFKLDCENLPEFLKTQLEHYPQEVIPIFQNSLQEIYMENFPENIVEIKFRPFNIGKNILIRNVEPTDIDRIVRVGGMISRVSGIIPEIKKAMFHCIKCNRNVFVDSIKNMINEPTNCDCGQRLTFEIQHNDGIYTDKQIVRLQELPEGIPDGTTPMTLTIVSKEDLVDLLIPGDKVVVTGILKAVPVRLNPAFKKIKSSFRIFVELISVQVLNQKEKEIDYLEEINSLRKLPNIYDILSGSIAPSIFGLENVKKSLLLQLFGGICKNLKSSRLRGDINILLAGDPGISKSQLLSFINRISERGIYTSGRGSSAVGLTASVSKDPDSGQFVLESGALVLSDNGICCIDEFDKMNDITKSVLHEVMEQQTVSVAKAGIITTLNARCSILASCNPIESKYNVKKSIIENLSLQPTLLSRFDIVALLIDKPDEINDKRVADHIFDMYTSEKELDPQIPIGLLKAYIKEAKKLNPLLTEDSMNAISDAYVDLRQLDNGNSITATTRQLESLVRLSEAHARMRFSKFVERVDVIEAVRLIKESLLIYALDPRTGKIDMDMIITGHSAANTKIIEDLKCSIMKLMKSSNRKNMLFSELISIMNFDEKLIRGALKELEIEDCVFYNEKTGTIENLK